MAKRKRHWSDEIPDICDTWRRKLRRYRTKKEAWDKLPYEVLIGIIKNTYDGVYIDKNSLETLMIAQKIGFPSVLTTIYRNDDGYDISYCINMNFLSIKRTLVKNINALVQYAHNTDLITTMIDNMCANFIRRYIKFTNVRIKELRKLERVL